MLIETVYIEHPVNRLQDYIEKFFKTLEDIDENIKQFDENLCDENFRTYINRAPTLKKHLSDFFKLFIN